MASKQADLTTEDELAIIERFVERINKLAEENIAKTFRLEGSHYAAMTAELNRMRAEARGVRNGT